MSEIIKAKLFQGNEIPDNEEPLDIEMFALGKVGAKNARQISWKRLKNWIRNNVSSSDVETPNYTLNAIFSKEGGFKIRLKYKCGYNTGFSIDLFPIADAHVYFSEFIDKISEVNDYRGDQGSLTINRWYTESVNHTTPAPLQLILQGNVVGMYLGDYNTQFWGDPNYDPTRYKLIDLSVAPVTLTLNSTVPFEPSKPDQNITRVIVIKGYYIRD